MLKSPRPTELRIGALLPLPPSAAISFIEKRAREIGFQPIARTGGLSVALSGGDLWLSARGGQTRLEVVAQDLPHVQMLRDFLTAELAATGIVPEWQGRRPDGRPDNHAHARVVSVAALSPSYRRVTLAGPDLARFVAGGLHFSLLLGPKGAGWPVTDGNGVTRWPGGSAAWHRPVYTTRRVETLPDGDARLSFDVFIHDGGRVTDWCRRVAPGEEIVLSGPAGDKGLAGTGWQGFVGDETALPVIARLLERLPAETRGQAVIVIPTAADIQPLPAPPGLRLDWALRETGATPLAALAGLDIPPAERAVFFAASRSEAQAARAALMARGLDKAEFTAAAYWTDREAAGC